MISKFRSGESLRNPRHINQVVDGVNNVTRNQGEWVPGLGQSGIPVFAINQSDIDLPFGACVAFKLNDAMPYPLAPTRLAHETTVLLTAPTEEGVEWGITAQRIAPGGSGWIYASGIILARIRDAASTDTQVTIDITDDWWHLKRTDAGGGTILWVDTVSQSLGSGDPYTYKWALIRFPIGGGGGGGAFSVVQAVGNGSAGVVSVKAVQLKATPGSSPNYEQTGDAYNLNYFKA